MGFGGEVRSAKGHYEEFVCSICQSLVDLDESVLTSCSHVFCTVCMKKWLERKRECPTCKHDLSFVSTSNMPYLKTGNPLAWRVLSRVRISCPLSCGWEGDYSELQSHLTSSSEHLESSSSLSPADLAMALKQQANEKYSSRNYKDALKLYTKAISTCPELAVLYVNRAAVYLVLQMYALCFDDAKKAVELDATFTKAWVRGTRALIGAGKFDAAVLWLQECPDNVASEKAIRMVKREALELKQALFEAHSDLKAGDFSSARNKSIALLSKCGAPNVLLVAARSELEAGSIERGNKLALQALRASPQNPQGYACMALASLYSGQIEEAMKFIKECLRLDPDDSEGKNAFKKVKQLRNCLKLGAEKTKEKKYDDAINVFSELLDANLLPPRSTLLATIYADRGNANFRAGNLDEALKDSARAIYIQDDCKRAWLTKSYVLHAQNKHEEALKELEPLMEKWGQSDSVIRGAYEKAQFNVRKAKRPDYYKLLSTPPETVLTPVSSEVEIKAGYKKKALLCHPDRLGADATKEERENAEAEFKLVGEGLEILTDSFKRKLYDEGFDKEAIEERVQRAHKQGHGHH